MRVATAALLAWCALAGCGLEGSTYEGDDFITRILQVPADPVLVCP